MRASSGPQVSIAKTYRDETNRKCRLPAKLKWPSSAVEEILMVVINKHNIYLVKYNVTGTLVLLQLVVPTKLLLATCIPWREVSFMCINLLSTYVLKKSTVSILPEVVVEQGENDKPFS